ncbi:hypothetical protein AGMMS49960_09090 [Betaproteobacteria bacterium]|nr:hypothetical protein AGMMS49543_07520 [Betaproteobacteria bacterium]GHU00628.1 hypothetical protein AGMMS49960_09090 [Betaproteobacteria bacterium]GHU19691.1 hypothetical protein AGMMS50243_12300 [Betaproteobacteria bacterium]
MERKSTARSPRRVPRWRCCPFPPYNAPVYNMDSLGVMEMKQARQTRKPARHHLALAVASALALVA